MAFGVAMQAPAEEEDGLDDEQREADGRSCGTGMEIATHNYGKIHHFSWENPRFQ